MVFFLLFQSFCFIALIEALLKFFDSRNQSDLSVFASINALMKLCHSRRVSRVFEDVKNDE